MKVAEIVVALAVSVVCVVIFVRAVASIVGVVKLEDILKPGIRDRFTRRRDAQGFWD